MTRQRWLLAMSAVVAAGAAWLAVDNVGDGQPIPAVCFALSSAVFLVQTVVLVVIGRRGRAPGGVRRRR